MKPLSCFVTKSSFCWLRDNTPSVMKWIRSEPYLTGLVPSLLKCTRTWQWNWERTRSVKTFSRLSNITSGLPNLYSKTGTSWVDSIPGHVSPRVTSWGDWKRSSKNVASQTLMNLWNSYFLPTTRILGSGMPCWTGWRLMIPSHSVWWYPRLWRALRRLKNSIRIFYRILTNWSQLRLMQYPRRRASKAQATSEVEVGDNIAIVGVGPSAGIVGQPIPQRNVQHMERSASLTKRRGILSNSARALSITIHKAVVVIAGNPGRTCMI